MSEVRRAASAGTYDFTPPMSRDERLQQIRRRTSRHSVPEGLRRQQQIIDQISTTENVRKRTFEGQSDQGRASLASEQATKVVDIRKMMEDEQRRRELTAQREKIEEVVASFDPTEVKENDPSPKKPKPENIRSAIFGGHGLRGQTTPEALVAVGKE